MENNNLKILVVDDDADWRVNAKDWINLYASNKKINCEIYAASTIEEGFKILDEKKLLDLIILDVNIKTTESASNSDGIDKFLIPLRNKGYNGKILCWSSNGDYKEPSKEKGADEFLRKIQIRRLGEILDTMFKK